MAQVVPIKKLPKNLAQNQAYFFLITNAKELEK